MKPTIDMTDEELQAIFEDESRTDAERLDAWMFTPSQDWFVEAVPLIHNVLAQLAASAAGEWRYDVANAPLGELVMCRWIDGSWDKAKRIPPEKTHKLVWCNERGAMLLTPIAFAVPNPPQVTP